MRVECLPRNPTRWTREGSNPDLSLCIQAHSLFIERTFQTKMGCSHRLVSGGKNFHKCIYIKSCHYYWNLRLQKPTVTFVKHRGFEKNFGSSVQRQWWLRLRRYFCVRCAQPWYGPDETIQGFIFIMLIMIANQLTPLIQRPPHFGWRIFHTAKVLNMSTSWL